VKRRRADDGTADPGMRGANIFERDGKAILI